MHDEQLTASQEDYLEAILKISEEKQAARAKDIADRMEVKGSSVTNALRLLSARGLVNYAPYDLITLTDEGRKVAEEIARRHEALRHFLITVLGIKEDEADASACKMEHAVSKLIVDRLIKYSEYIQDCPQGGITWDSGFGYYCKKGCDDQQCGRRPPPTP
jgi:DtxR family Mn-dependent transcriptional regulator